MTCGFAYTSPYTLTPGQPPPGLSYLPASPHRLTYYPPGSQRSTTLDPKAHGSRRWLAQRGSSWALLRGYGNINPLSIDYASRPRLRSRLTQGGLAWPWNPWSSGGRVSHPVFRYSCLHSHSCHLHSWITPLLHPATRRSPTHPHTWTHPQGCRPGTHVNATASAVCLSPATLSARNHLTSELLRTLSRVAASKPTSWLSMRPHILFHLAHA